VKLATRRFHVRRTEQLWSSKGSRYFAIVDADPASAGPAAGRARFAKKGITADSMDKGVMLLRRDGAGVGGEPPRAAGTSSSRERRDAGDHASKRVAINS